MTSEYEQGFNAGAIIACAANRISPEEFAKQASTDAKLSYTPSFQQDVCKIAECIFKRAGYEGTLEHTIYDNLSKSTRPLSEVSVTRFIDPVLGALRKEASAIHEEMMEKSANPVGGIGKFFSSLFGAGTSTLPEALKYYTMAALTAGTGIGALNWYLNRDAEQNSADVDAKKEQAKHYKRIANDIKSRLALDEKDKEEDAAKDMGEGAYII